MFKRRLKKRCLPDWIGTPNETKTPVDPVCSVSLQTQCTTTVSEAPSYVHTKKDVNVENESNRVQHSSEISADELQMSCKNDSTKSLDLIKKNTKKVNKKRKLGVNFLGTSKSSSERELRSRLFDEHVAQSLPLLICCGSVIYSYNTNDCSLLCEELAAKLPACGEQDLFVGFDMEWPVLYQRGHGSGKVALIQISFSEESCYLFHIAAMGTFPKSLKLFLQDNRLKKIGINIESDWWKLERDFDGIQAKTTIASSVIDLSKLANEKLKSCENWSLEGLCRHVLKMRIDKNEDIRCGRWDDCPLSEQQQMYAAVDAHACLKIFNSLSSATLR
ncbi:Werner syndrome ATP-dependent helicase homolog [Gigantopelta aegis]|uniref:Werner syndrome ATP-dependent helicase homolog n=1 Tax=Gigantopelta aegis TaxID=1735272 RepID=UPI001B88BCE5|nr:Werner syndrome ATP-dependent helicase homolog [Gigantopelta aegis]